MTFKDQQTGQGSPARRRRICIVATVPFAFNVFMRSHIDLLKIDYDVTLVANGKVDELEGLLGEHVRFVAITIERKISLKKDVLALIKLWFFFRREKFDGVCSLLPKSGLLAMLSARFCGIPIRLNIFNGEVWANDRGVMRYLLKFTDRVIVACATHLLAVSPSQRDFLVQNRIVKVGKMDVVANGSITGVDENRFKPDAVERAQLRAVHGIPRNALVFLFLGRVNRDKGVLDLINAFVRVTQSNTSHHLLVVGPDEESLDAELLKLTDRFPERVHRVGFTDHPESYMAVSDVICLPSYREGFGMVLIEAAAAGLPAIASRIYGITDAVEEGVTGLFHEAGNVNQIAEAMLLLGEDETMRRDMAEAARRRAIEEFSQSRVKNGFLLYYRETFSRRKRLLITANSAASLISHRLPLALAARKNGYEVHIATSSGSGVDAIVAAGLIHHAIPLSRSGMNLSSEFQTVVALYRLFVKVKPDVVHLVTIKPVLYGGISARMAGVSGVVAAISGLGFIFMNSGFKVALVRLLVLQVYKLAFGKRNLKVIFQNPDDCAVIMKQTGLHHSKVVMIRGSGVDLASFKLESLPQGVPVVAMAARLLRDKGVNEFVEAATLLRERGITARFWLVGDSDPGNPTSISDGQLDAWRQAGIVELLGYRADVASLFSQTYMVVLPSYREGLPKVLLEAAACGRAVVTSNVPGCRDAIEAGMTGLLVPPRNSTALADAIEYLLSNPELCESMGRAARQLAEREFSVEKIVGQHLKVYSDLIELPDGRFP